MSAALFYLPFPAAFTSNGLPSAGAKVYFYLTGTTTKATVYSDEALTTPRTNPVVADGAGRLPAIYLDNTQILRADITDKNGALLTSVDPYIPGTIAGTVIGSGGVVVQDRAELASIVGTTDVAVGLMESGREGTFIWDASNLSAKVTLDVYQAIYVPPATDTTGASGAWVRQLEGPLYANWAGLADGATVNAARLESLIGLLDSARGNWIVLPFGQVTMDRRILITKPCRIEGRGMGNGNSGSSTASGNTLLVFPAGSSGFRIKHAASVPTGQQTEISNLRIAASSVLTTTGTGTFSGSGNVTLSAAGDFANDQVVRLEGGGPSMTVQDRTVAITSGAAVATVTNTVSGIGNPGVYNGQIIDIAGAGLAGGTTVSSWNSTTITASANAASTVSGAAYTVKYPYVFEIASGGGTTTLVPNSGGHNLQSITNGTVRHAACGVMASIQCHLRNVEIMGFQIGVFLHGNTTGGEVADMCSFYNCTINCTWAGVVCQGYDAQVNSFYTCNFAGSEIGVLDNSILGNDFYGCHWAFNVGIAVPNATAVTKIIGGYFESGTSYVTGASNNCSFYGTTSMINGSGWQGVAAGSAQLTFGHIETTKGADLKGGVALGGSGAGASGYRIRIAPGSVVDPVYPYGSGPYVDIYNDATRHWWFTSSGSDAWRLDGGPIELWHNAAQIAKTSATGFGPISGKAVELGGTAVIDSSLNGIFASFTASSGKSGYTTGAGGTVTQATDKSTGVTLNKVCGQITMHNASLASATSVKFTLTNSNIAATDVVNVNIASGAADPAAYGVWTCAVGSGSCAIVVRNNSGGALGEALVLNFMVAKAVAA